MPPSSSDSAQREIRSSRDRDDGELVLASAVPHDATLDKRHQSLVATLAGRPPKAGAAVVEAVKEGATAQEREMLGAVGHMCGDGEGGQLLVVGLQLGRSPFQARLGERTGTFRIGRDQLLTND